MMLSLNSRGHTIEAYSAVFAVVHAFRQAHGLDPAGNPAAWEKSLALYPLKDAYPDGNDAITQISTPNEYTHMRQSGRYKSPHPPLWELRLKNVCAEIHAAFVWKSQRSLPASN